MTTRALTDDTIRVNALLTDARLVDALIAIAQSRPNRAPDAAEGGAA